MNMNPVDWAKAQNLLVKLVQVLTPLAVEKAESAFFLNKRFFIPPSEQESFHIQHSVKLLSNLHSIQKNFDEILEKPSMPVSENKKDKKEGKGGEKSIEKSVTKNESKSFFNATKQFTTVPETDPSLLKQAKSLINQVHDAISKLSSSSNFKNPQEIPLRETLKKLKPQLDRIIETMTYEEGKPINKRLEFRHPLPKSLRSAIFASVRDTEDSKDVENKTIQSNKKRILPDQEKMRLFETSKQKKDPLKNISSLSSKNFSNPRKEIEKESHHSLEKAPLPKSDSVRSDRKDPMYAPYLVSNRTFPLPKKKKKRKGFWFKGEEKEETDNS